MILAHRFPLTVILLAFAAFLAFPAGNAAAQLIEKEIRRGVMDNPNRLDPQLATLPSEKAVLADLFMGLVTENAAGAVEPGAAESWKVSSDGLTWTFTLREGQKWSDGRALNAGDFVYAFQRLLAPRSGAPFASMFYNIKGAEDLHRGNVQDVATLGVKAKGGRILIFTLTERSPQFLAQLVHHSAYPLRKDHVERADQSWTLPGKMVTNGPYILSEWLPGNYLKLTKNWRFFDPASVNIDIVYYDIVEFAESALERFSAGEMQILSGVPRDEIGGLMKTTPEAVRLYPTLNIDYLVFNTKKPPLNDVRIREALSLAIDSQTLVRNVLGGGEIPATRLLPEGLAGLREPEGVQKKGPFPRARPFSASERRKAAQQLLTNTGYGVKDSLRLTLRYNANGIHQKIAEAIADMWKKVGVRTDLYSNDYTVHYGDLGLGDFDVARAGWIADYNDPAAFMILLDPASEQFNYGRFADEEFAKRLAVTDKRKPDARAIAMYRAQEAAMKQFPIVPLYHHASRNLVASTVTGWEDNIRDIHPSRYLKLVEPPQPAPEQQPQTQQ